MLGNQLHLPLTTINYHLTDDLDDSQNSLKYFLWFTWPMTFILVRTLGEVRLHPDQNSVKNSQFGLSAILCTLSIHLPESSLWKTLWSKKQQWKQQLAAFFRQKMRSLMRAVTAESDPEGLCHSLDVKVPQRLAWSSTCPQVAAVSEGWLTVQAEGMSGGNGSLEAGLWWLSSVLCDSYCHKHSHTNWLSPPCFPSPYRWNQEPNKPLLSSVTSVRCWTQQQLK